MMADREELRDQTYNAEVIHKQLITDDLAIFHILPDTVLNELQAGQFVNIGLFDFETPAAADAAGNLIKRAYSVSSPIIDDSQNLIDFQGNIHVELYITRVPNGLLTPKLFELEVHSRLFMQPRALGHYTLPKIAETDTIIFASTGTGIAPHNAMITELLTQGHSGPVIVFDSVRYRVDLGYRRQLHQLEADYTNLKYIPLVTREDDQKYYIQDFFREQRLQNEYDIIVDPSHTHVFCCGNPAMIGIPKRNRETGEYEFPEKGGLVECLMKNFGLSIYKAKTGGNIHFEKYW